VPICRCASSISVIRATSIAAFLAAAGAVPLGRQIEMVHAL
jgi:hypothetical protein